MPAFARFARYGAAGRELRLAARLLLQRPGFTATAVATIALAIAANTLMFGIIRAVLLDPLPVPEPERVVRIEQVHRRGMSNVTGATFVDLRARARMLSAVAAFRVAPVTFSDRDATPIQATATTMTAGYFDVLALRPAAGRAPSADDFRPGAAPVVFISDSLWRRMFDGRASAIGRTVLVNASASTIAGVMDMPASLPGAADVWLPYPDDAALLRNRRARLFTVIGRLNGGASIESAGAELDAVARQIRAESPDAGSDMSLRATSLAARMAQPVRSSLLLLWSAVGLLLLIALTNVANLLLMQGSLRARELSLRAALGAPRATLVRQLAIESGVLGLAGGVVGAALGSWGVAVSRSLLPASLPRVSEIRADGGLLLLAVAVSIVATLLFGLLPAVHASKRDAAAALRARDGARSGSRIRNVLVGAEVALTLALLFAAGLLGRSMLRLSNTPLGFDPQGVVTVDLSLPAARYADAAAHARFYAQLIDRLRAIPGVAVAGATGALPLSPTAATTMIPQDGRTDQQSIADVIAVTPGALEAFRIPVVKGRSMTDRDDAAGAPVALINETAARQFWPAGVDPVGRTIEMRDWGAPYRATVVGVLGDLRQAAPDQPPAPAVFYPLAQFPQTTLTQTVVVRIAAPIDRVMPQVRAAVVRVDPDQPIAFAAPMQDRIAVSLAPRRLNLQLLAAFAAAALLLAGVGIYGLVAFAMAARTREIGVRMALGASPRQIAALSFARGATPVLAGIAAGVVAALAAADALAGLVYGIAPRDPATLIFAVALVLAATLAAIAAPTRRALRVDPAVTLRAE
jgi:predicted permease